MGGASGAPAIGIGGLGVGQRHYNPPTLQGPHHVPVIGFIGGDLFRCGAHESYVLAVYGQQRMQKHAVRGAQTIEVQCRAF